MATDDRQNTGRRGRVCYSQLTNTVQGVTAVMAALHVRTGEDGQMSSELLGSWADEYGPSEDLRTAGEDGRVANVAIGDSREGEA